MAANAGYMMAAHCMMGHGTHGMHQHMGHHLGNAVGAINPVVNPILYNIIKHYEKWLYAKLDRYDIKMCIAQQD